MVEHIILWKIKETYDEEKKQQIMANAKKELEGLKNKIDGIVDIEVIIEKLPSSNVDMMLKSKFISEEALNNYSKNPYHVAVADNYIRPFVSERNCIDFEGNR